MKKDTFQSLDICKLLMSFCVVAIHTRPLDLCTEPIVNEIYNSLVAMAVPFFFLCSGFLLAQKFEPSISAPGNTAIIKRYLLKMIKMYVVWNVVYLPMAIYHLISSGNSLLLSVLRYIRGFVFVGEQYNSWHLWYLLSTIYALMFLLILLRLKQSPGNIMAISCFVFLLSIGMNCLSAYDGNTNSLIAFLKKMLEVSVASGRIFTGMFYLPIGIMLSRKRPGLNVSWSMLIGGYILNVFVRNDTLNTVLAAISTIGLFCVLLSFTIPHAKIYPFIRKMSTVIYFIHMYVWSIFYMLVYGKKTYGWYCFLMTSFISLVIAAVSVAVINRHKEKKPSLC